MSEADGLVCWNCGASIAALTLPLGRLEECKACRSPLHVCRLCVHFEPRLPKQCREEGAEEVRAKDRANFCDWFRPRPGAFDAGRAAAADRARAELDALFGAPATGVAGPGPKKPGG